MESSSRVVIAGASGFIGQRLVQEFTDLGHEVIRIGRRGADITWSDQTAIDEAVDGSEILINLAGKSVNCRYTERNRNEILNSRLRTTSLLRAAVEKAERPPAVWLNASTATMYRHAMDRPMNEHDGEIGSGFSVDVARNWERQFFTGNLPNTRRVALRMSIVIGHGPATNMLLKLGELGLGGAQYDGWWLPHQRYRGIGPDPTQAARPHYRSRGKQKFSWIHVDDVVGAIHHIIAKPELSGPVNLAAPQVTTNKRLMRTIRTVVGRKIGLPAFRWMLEPAMWALRTEPELVLKSRWIDSAVLRSSGYEFRWPDLEKALRSIVS